MKRLPAIRIPKKKSLPGTTQTANLPKFKPLDEEVRQVLIEHKNVMPIAISELILQYYLMGVKKGIDPDDCWDLNEVTPGFSVDNQNLWRIRKVDLAGKDRYLGIQQCSVIIHRKIWISKPHQIWCDCENRRCSNPRHLTIAWMRDGHVEKEPVIQRFGNVEVC